MKPGIYPKQFAMAIYTCVITHEVCGEDPDCSHCDTARKYVEHAEFVIQEKFRNNSSTSTKMEEEEP